MKTKRPLLIVALLLSLAFTRQLYAQSSAFTYQGVLNDNGSPANGLYDVKASLTDSDNETALVLAGPLTNSAVAVSNGLFTVTLDFGASVFSGANLFLEIGIRTNGVGVFSALSPRQPLTAAPYAIQSLKAASITGTVPLALLPAEVVTNGASGVNFSGTFNGDAAGLSNLNSSSLTGPLTVAEAALVNVGHNYSGGYAGGVAVAGNYAYLANSNDGLRVYDISNPVLPVSVGHATNYASAYGYGVAVAGNYAYLANSYDGLRVYDISNPALPVNVGHGTNYAGGTAVGVAVAGNYAYLANQADGLRVYDISNPALPVNVGHTNNGGKAWGVAVAGNYAYLANEADGLRVYDISNPAQPINVSQTNNGGAAYDVAVAGNYAYLANHFDGWRVYDISNPTNLINIGHVPTYPGEYARGVAVSGHYACLANESAGLRLYDISNPAQPINLGHIDNGGNARRVTVSGNYAYLANGEDGMRVYELGEVDTMSFKGSDLELKVNNQRALRIESTAATPNLIGGDADNSIASSSYGSVISGGGAPGVPNSIGANSAWSTIGGGFNHQIRANAESATIGGEARTKSFPEPLIPRFLGAGTTALPPTPSPPDAAPRPITKVRLSGQTPPMRTLPPLPATSF